jgi:hypothetical protein
MSDPTTATAAAAPVNPAAAPRMSSERKPRQRKAAPVKDAVAAEEAEKSKTELFKELLQHNLGAILGMKISKEIAWKLFKETVETPVSFCLTLPAEDRRLPLAGLGTYSIRMSKPRAPVTRAGAEKKESRYAGFKEIPHFRFKPSDRIRKFLDSTILGLQAPAGEEPAAATTAAPAAATTAAPAA